MATAIQEYSYIGKGVVKLKKGAAEARAVGNCSALSLKITTEEKELADYTAAGGGTANKITRIKSVDIELDLRELSPDNLALALLGDVAVDALTKKATIEALTQTGSEYQLVFEGLNEAQSGALVDVTVHRFKPSPAEELPLIGDDFATLKLKGAALADRTQPAGKSRFFFVEMDTEV